MRARRVACAVAVAAVMAALTLGGCYTTIREIPSTPPTQPPAATEATTVPLPPGPTEMVVVPDVVGKYADAATAELEAAGLQANEVSTHGPQDPDAGEPGAVYRQKPAAGAEAVKGTSVEIRTWWESQ